MIKSSSKQKLRILIVQSLSCINISDIYIQLSYVSKQRFVSVHVTQYVEPLSHVAVSMTETFFHNASIAITPKRFKAHLMFPWLALQGKRMTAQQVTNARWSRHL